jgi:ankyrin repeat protein
MSTEADRAAVRLFRIVEAAFKRGDFEDLRIALKSDRWFAEPMPIELGGDYALKLAIDWSSVAFISQMIDAGSDPDEPGRNGFPGLIAALASSRWRGDYLRIVQLLIDRGANVDVRGVHNWTPLHYATATRDGQALTLLLASGADPSLPSDVDLASRPVDLARAYGFSQGVALLEASTHG